MVAEIAGGGVRAAEVSDALASDVVVLALWYPGTTDFGGEHAAELDGKIVVDISDPLDESWIRLGIDPSTSSVASVGRKPEKCLCTTARAFEVEVALGLADARVDEGTAPRTTLSARQGLPDPAPAGLPKRLFNERLEVRGTGRVRHAREEVRCDLLHVGVDVGLRLVDRIEQAQELGAGRPAAATYGGSLRVYRTFTEVRSYVYRTRLQVLSGAASRSLSFPLRMSGPADGPSGWIRSRRKPSPELPDISR